MSGSEEPKKADYKGTCSCGYEVSNNFYLKKLLSKDIYQVIYQGMWIMSTRTAYCRKTLSDIHHRDDALSIGETEGRDT
jgi:hypothetical protein